MRKISNCKIFSFQFQIIVGEEYGTALKSVPPEEEDQALDLASIWDFEGYLKYSPLFYGYYGNKEMIGGFYRGPLAYFLTGISIFVLSFVVVLLKYVKPLNSTNLSKFLSF